MSASEERVKLNSARASRNEAARYLQRMTKERDEMRSVLPAIEQAVILEVADFVERQNELIDELEELLSSGSPERYLQSAFSFLYECAINENEIPF